MENAKVIMEKVYTGESIVDIERDIYDSIDDLPVDEDGFAIGTIKVVVTHIP